MKRNQLKEVTDAFVNELVEVRVSQLKGYGEHSTLYIGGKWIDIYGDKREVKEKLAKDLRASIGKVFRKHIKQLMESQP